MPCLLHRNVILVSMHPTWGLPVFANRKTHLAFQRSPLLGTTKQVQWCRSSRAVRAFSPRCSSFGIEKPLSLLGTMIEMFHDVSGILNVEFRRFRALPLCEALWPKCCTMSPAFSTCDVESAFSTSDVKNARDVVKLLCYDPSQGGSPPKGVVHNSRDVVEHLGHDSSNVKGPPSRGN